MPSDQQIFAFWRIALNRHPGGISAVFGGPVHTYEARITTFDARYLNDTHLPKPIDIGCHQLLTVVLSKRERNNW